MGVAVGISLPLTFSGYKIISAVMFFAGAAFSGYGSYLLGDTLIAADFSGKAVHSFVCPPYSVLSAGF